MTHQPTITMSAADLIAITRHYEDEINELRSEVSRWNYKFQSQADQRAKWEHLALHLLPDNKVPEEGVVCGAHFAYGYKLTDKYDMETHEYRVLPRKPEYGE